MYLNIYTNSAMQQNNTVFGCKSKGFTKLLMDPAQRELLENVMKDKHIPKLKKQEFLKTQVFCITSSPKDLFRNIVANLKLMFSKNV